MELTLSHLDLPNATSPIPDYGQGLDPYQAIQLHDYQSVSFFRQPAEIKASSTKIIDLFQRYYPETVSYKYFANVPLLMQWMMGAMKALMSKDSIQKMTWTSYGNTLDQYLGKDVPKEYGGNGPALEGRSLLLRLRMRLLLLLPWQSLSRRLLPQASPPRLRLLVLLKLRNPEPAYGRSHLVP